MCVGVGGGGVYVQSFVHDVQSLQYKWIVEIDQFFFTSFHNPFAPLLVEDLNAASDGFVDWYFVQFE